MLEKIILELGAWSWWALGLAFLVLEIILPGIFFLWVGLAALVVGTVALLVPLDWQVQLIGFAFLGLIFALLGRRLNHKFGKMDNARTLNDRGSHYIGQTFTLEETIEDGKGRVKIGDSLWIVRCSENLNKGEKVNVIKAEGSVLIIEKA